MNGNPLPSLKILAAGAAVPLAPLAGWRPVRGGADLAAQLREERPDLLVLDAAGIGPELAALLMSAAFADMPLLLLASDDDAEKVGLLLERPMRILPVPAEPGQLAALVAEAAAGLAGGVADANSRYEADDRLAALKRDAERVAAALADLAGLRGPETARPVTAARIRAHIKARRNRERFFAAELFSDPVWDILLDLSASRLEDRPVSVSSLCIAAHVPTTTALRTIKMLVDRGLLTRRNDPADARRSFIALSAHAASAMEGCLEAVLNQQGQ
jgi:DNA-binding MarR family transcriptional regulator